MDKLTARESQRRQAGKTSGRSSEAYGTGDNSRSESCGEYSVEQPAPLTEGQKELTASHSQAPCTAASRRKSRQGARKAQLTKLPNVLMSRAVGSDSRGRRFNCRRVRGLGKAKTEQGQSGIWKRSA